MCVFINLSRTPQPLLTAAKAVGTPTINYRVFLQGTLDFIIIVFVMFIK
jgi:large-conductance mechanosensitive channel